jgi:hypothetical protein
MAAEQTAAREVGKAQRDHRNTTCEGGTSTQTRPQAP